MLIAIYALSFSSIAYFLEVIMCFSFIFLYSDPCKMFCCANGGVCKLDSGMMPMCECSGSWNGTHCEGKSTVRSICQLIKRQFLISNIYWITSQKWKKKKKEEKKSYCIESTE